VPEGEGRFLLLGLVVLGRTKKKAARKGCVSGGVYRGNAFCGQYRETGRPKK